MCWDVSESAHSKAIVNTLSDRVTVTVTVKCWDNYKVTVTVTIRRWDKVAPLCTPPGISLRLG